MVLNSWHVRKKKRKSYGCLLLHAGDEGSFHKLGASRSSPPWDKLQFAPFVY